MTNRVTALNPERVLVVGDTHAQLQGLEYGAIALAEAEGINVLLVVGDFGYWPRNETGRRFLAWLTKLLEENDLTLLFVDGNHEDFLVLNGVPVEEDGVRVISPRIWHLPRGFRWEWGGIKMAALGGGYSVDRQWRSRGTSWFEEELVSDDEVEHFIAGGPADIVFMHDSPAGAPNQITDLPKHQIAGMNNFGPTALAEAALHREQLRRAIDPVAPSLIFHGHYHKKMSGQYTHSNGKLCFVYGLDETASSVHRHVHVLNIANTAETIADMGLLE